MSKRTVQARIAVKETTVRSELEPLKIKKLKHSFPIYPTAFKASLLASRTLPIKSVATLLKYFLMVGSKTFFEFC